MNQESHQGNGQEHSSRHLNLKAAEEVLTLRTQTRLETDAKQQFFFFFFILCKSPRKYKQNSS